MMQWREPRTLAPAVGVRKMYEASHGFRCSSRTWPTRCRSCSAKVFYFSCNCGSKVFFDSLGGSWPQHRCGPSGQRGGGGSSAEHEIRTGFRRSVAQGLITIRFEDRYERIVQDAAPARRVARQRDPAQEIVRQDPYDELRAGETGIVREIVQPIDLYQRLGLTETSMSAAYLAPLGSLDAQITIHTHALGEEDHFSFTFLLDASSRNALRIERGDLVSCTLRGVEIPNGDPFWVCESIETPE